MKKFSAFFAVIIAALVLSTGISVGARQACTKDVITEDDIVRQQENTPPTNNWVLYTRTPASTGVFRTGPAAPPSGIGSLETVTPTGGDKVFLFNYDHVGTELADIDAISYATYRDTGASPNQVPAINIQVDINGGTLNPGEFTTLVFEPVYNTNQGAIQDDTWQTWDAYAGGQAIWWSSRPIPGVCAFDCFVTWDQIIAANPDATIVGGFGINQGSGNPALIASSDVLTIGYNDECVTYDFEPYEVATNKEACKSGGWKTLRRADGSPFKNQGDCIQYVNTGK
jgi:hypothetical protein